MSEGNLDRLELIRFLESIDDEFIPVEALLVQSKINTTEEDIKYAQEVISDNSCSVSGERIPEPNIPLEDMDIEAFLNIRTWLEQALVSKGGVITDGGMGMGQADIGFELEGYSFGLQLRPRPEVKVNLPFERIPQHANDPGHGEIPEESNIVNLIDEPMPEKP